MWWLSLKHARLPLFFGHKNTAFGEFQNLERIFWHLAASPWQMAKTMKANQSRPLESAAAAASRLKLETDLKASADTSGPGENQAVYHKLSQLDDLHDSDEMESDYEVEVNT